MEENTYNHALIEPKWQKVWAEKKLYKCEIKPGATSKPKKYILDMFPYPSGSGLHVGHPKGYTATDVLARMHRMKGFNVLYAMGWDAFGLPAERAAEREGLHPADITKRNTDSFRSELQRLGLSYDWEREINTSLPEYYRWTQWIWLKLYEKGLAYLAEVPVNWCAKLGTVVANEEVFEGKYIETGDPVERRLMKQWMLRITAYADRLLADLDTLDWPESIKEMQRNWIGRSTGAKVAFQVKESDQKFIAFTTRVDTLAGVTFCVISTEAPGLLELTTPEQREAVRAYVEEAAKKVTSEKKGHLQEKTGVFTGRLVVNPLTGEEIPLWVADYVQAGYGSGFVMGVPGHDERDHQFAIKFGLPVRAVVAPIDSERALTEGELFTDDGVLINSGAFSGVPSEEARKQITAWLEERKLGELDIQYRLRDWLFSRQRFWGEPFPVVHLEDGSTVPVPETQLPVVLPALVKESKGATDVAAPLSRASDDWLMVTLPDGRTGIRETNTMPQWAGSCWYYLRYIDPQNATAAWDPELEKYWMPVDVYVGGVEHAVLHLLYARFWHKVLYDCGIVSTIEPFQKLFNQGLVQAPSYRDSNGRYYKQSEVVERDKTWFVRDSGQPVVQQIEKMSKSKLNGVGLKEFISDHGADALRLFEIFIGPVGQPCSWSSDSVEGVKRFLERVWRIVIDDKSGGLRSSIGNFDEKDAPDLLRELHVAIAQVTQSIESIDKMNTAISALMTLSHALYRAEKLPKSIVGDFLKLLAPFAPHIADELWQRLGNEGSVTVASWPHLDESLLRASTCRVAVQFNGKTRGDMEIVVDASDEAVKQQALAAPNFAKYIEGKEIKKAIVVKNKIVNFVVA